MTTNQPTTRLDVYDSDTDVEDPSVDQGYVVDDASPLPHYSDYPFWYSSSSGPQHFRLKPSRTSESASLSNDPLLNFFDACGDSESRLDEYFNGVISGRVHAANIHSPESLSDEFGACDIPQSVSTDLQSYLATLKSKVIDNSTRVSSSKMIGHMTTALPYFHRPLARLLVALNQNVVKLETSSTLTFLERETAAQLHSVFYNRPSEFYKSVIHAAASGSPDASVVGLFCSGGTVANITALWCARNTALGPRDGFLGVEREGLVRALRVYGYEGAVVIASKLVHYSVRKAVDLLGIGEAGLVLLETDSEFRIRIDLLEKKIEECAKQKILVIAVIGIVGTTETGSIDDLAAIAHLTSRNNIHFHVDAAWGGPLIFSPLYTQLLAAASLSTTLTIDGHKQLYTPMGVGLLLFRYPQSAHRIQKTASYIIRAGSSDLGRFSLEGSRPANSLYLHASLNILGRDGVARLVERGIELVARLARWVRTLDSFEA
ncbi:hypothetical protein HK096_000315, partial [Nowakowskiella sp. JEL0078]